MSLHNIDMEKAVIATLMGVDNAFDMLEVEITKDIFYAERHQILFGIISELKTEGMPYDAVMVADKLNNGKYGVESGGEEYLMELIINTPATTFNLDHYVNRLTDLAQRRRINEQFIKAQKLINNIEIDAADAWSEVAEGVNAAMQGSKGDEFYTLSELYDEYLEELQQNAIEGFKPTIKTGLIALDNKIMIEKGDMVVIAARPSMGKTTLAQNILKNIAETEEGVAVFFSVEMDRRGITKRMVSSIMDLDMKKAFSNQNITTEEWQRFKERSDYVRDLPFIVNDLSGISLGKMRAILNRIRQKYGKISAIMVDYIGLMKPENSKDSREQQISKLSAGLKGLAKEFDCPMFALSQLNRSLENRPDKRPVMSDLRDSGSIEQDADHIIFIYRDAVYNNKKEDGVDKAKRVLDQKPVAEKVPENLAELIIAKQRNGEIGMVKAKFEGRYNRFTDWVDLPEYDPFMGGQ